METIYVVATEGLILRKDADGTELNRLTIGQRVQDLGPASQAGRRRVRVAGQQGTVAEEFLRPLADPRIEALLDAAIAEWVRFDKGRGKENSAPFAQFIAQMWSAIDLSHTGHSNVPWSAAFISWVVRKAGDAYHEFKFSASHSVFVHDAIQARLTNKTTKPFWGYPIGDERPAIGDIIQRSRNGQAISFQQAASQTHYESHSDIVVEVRKGLVRVVGGNVSNSVTLGGTSQEYRLDERGFIVPDRPVIALLKNRTPSLPPP
jgi:hypothetical protein